VRTVNTLARGFIEQVVFGLDFNEVRVGLITYSTDAEVAYYLNTYTARSEVLESLVIPHRGGRTNTQEALRLADVEIFQSRAGDRDGVENIVILVSDGNANVDPEMTPIRAQELKDDGATIYVVAIGDTADMNVDTGVPALATFPDEPYVLQIREDDEVFISAEVLLRQLCSGT